MHVRAKKHLGQHFLRDLDAARRIAEGITKHRGCTDVLEVGPGTGALTRPLLQRGDLDVRAVELDEESVEYLTTQGVLPAEKVFGVDLLKWDPDEAFPKGAPFIVAGNFPYNISSQILFRVLDWRDRVPECVGMFQKEVAERVAEGPGSKTYGILSVLLQSYYDIDTSSPCTNTRLIRLPKSRVASSAWSETTSASSPMVSPLPTFDAW